MPGEPERAGRWWWEQNINKECGIHCSVELQGSPPDRERVGDGEAVEVDGAEVDGVAVDGAGTAPDARMRELADEEAR